jgi:hypothetical protein
MFPIFSRCTCMIHLFSKFNVMQNQESCLVLFVLSKQCQIWFVLLIRNPLCKSKSDFLGESIVKTHSKKKKVCANHHFVLVNFHIPTPWRKVQNGIVWCHIIPWKIKERIAIFSTKNLKISAICRQDLWPWGSQLPYFNLFLV